MRSAVDEPCGVRESTKLTVVDSGSVGGDEVGTFQRSIDMIGARKVHTKRSRSVMTGICIYNGSQTVYIVAWDAVSHGWL